MQNTLRLFALAFLFCVMSPAAAQGPGHWAVTIENDGTTFYNIADSNGVYNYTEDWYQTAGRADVTALFQWNAAVTVVSSGLAHLVATWVDSNGAPAANPPAKFYAVIYPEAVWLAGTSPGLYLQNFTHSADDGQGDPERVELFGGIPGRGISSSALVVDPDTGQGYFKPIALDSFMGTAKKDFNLSVNLSFNSDTPGGVGANCYLTARALNFHAGVSSSLDPSYYRVVRATGPARAVNMPDSNGNGHADAALSGDTLDATFNAVLSGDWSPASYYHWYSKSKDYAYSGTFTLPNMPPSPLTNTYTSEDKSEENIDLHLTDKITGYDTHADYSIKFHKKYEDWVRTNTVRHPVTFVHGSQNTDWTYVFRGHNPTSIPQEQDTGQEISLKLTMTGEIGLTQTLDPEGIAAFEFNEKITVGLEVAAKLTATQKFMIPPYTETDCYAGLSWEDRSGTNSVWGVHGYVDDEVWHGKWVSPILSFALDPTFLPHLGSPSPGGAVTVGVER